ncbi:MAG: DedA family protein [Caldilineaceae bacterium]|nr:DedA family protein [Caldilineaceae bacterium]
MLDWIEELIRDMGYIGLAFLMFLDTIFPPIPSETIMPLAGFLSMQEAQSMNFVGAVIAGTFGSVLAAVVLYYLGRVLGIERLKRWSRRYGKWILLDEDEIERGFEWFDRNGKAAVFFTRMIPGLRSLISIPAGANGMSLGVYLLYTIPGTGLWVIALAFVGRALSENYDNVTNVIRWATYATVLIVIAIIGFWVLKRKRSQG